MTLQPMVVLLAGALLGPLAGAAAMASYLAIGALGAPVFAGGHAGLPWLVGPTGGYLISTTACIRDFMPWLRFIAPLLRILGVIPHISIFTQNDLVGWMQAADLDITEVWLPKPKAGVFIIAQKA